MRSTVPLFLRSLTLLLMLASLLNSLAAAQAGTARIYLPLAVKVTGTSRVSVASDGSQGNWDSAAPSISSDGRFVAFHSTASNLVRGDTNDADDVFVHDRQTGETERVSVASDGSQANNGSGDGSISADGRYVAFTSWADNLVSGDSGNYMDVFVHDRQTGITTRVSEASGGSEANQSSASASISADGRFVAFSSEASNMVGGDTNGRDDIFVYDQQTAHMERVSLASDGTQGNEESGYPAISADGRFVAFQSFADNLVNGDNNDNCPWSVDWDNCPDVFVHDRQTGSTELVSEASGGAQGNFASWDSAISADGRFVAFSSEASNLVNADTNSCGDPGDGISCSDIFVHDRLSGLTERVSLASDGAQGNENSWNPAISADGRFVAFRSDANNLVGGDLNWLGDIFVRDRQRGQTELVSAATTGSDKYDWMMNPAISANGRYVAFDSAAANLVSGDTNQVGDVFVRDRGEGN